MSTLEWRREQPHVNPPVPRLDVVWIIVGAIYSAIFAVVFFATGGVGWMLLSFGWIKVTFAWRYQ